MPASPSPLSRDRRFSIHRKLSERKSQASTTSFRDGSPHHGDQPPPIRRPLHRSTAAQKHLHQQRKAAYNLRRQVTVSRLTGRRTHSSMSVQACVGLDRIDESQSTASFNPSLGPTPLMLADRPFRNSPPRPIEMPQNKLSTNTGCSRQDFRKGQIIWLPFHRPNQDPNIHPQDLHLSYSCEGPVYTKRRPFVILWIHAISMFCLPMYTFKGEGLLRKSQILHKEFVGVKAEGKQGEHPRQGPHSPVVASFSRSSCATSLIHLTGGVEVHCDEDICMGGRMTRDGYWKLLELHEAVGKAARDEPWE